MIILNLQHPPPLISWGTPHSPQSKNRVIAFTTPQNYAARLSDLIHLKGWTPLWCPTVIVEPTPQTISSIHSHISPNPNPLLEDFSAIAFTSRTGITAFSEALSSIGTYPLTPTGEILVISALGKDLELLDESFISRICENPERIRVVAPRIATPTGLVEALGDGEGRKRVLCPVPLVVGLEEPPNFGSSFSVMASWNSTPLEVLYNVLGWVAFVSWSISFYPQVILNFRRKSVIGLNFDFVVLNLTKHTSYLIYNASLFFGSAVQRQYRQKYGFDEMIPVAANDVAFSVHAVLLTAITLFQIVIYDRGNQKVSKSCTAIVSVAWLAIAVCVFIAIPKHSWLWLVSCFNILQVVMTVIKYIPQAVMNFRRKSTVGWSIGNILLDLLGGLTNYGQMAVQSIDQNSWVNFYGNIGKTLLSLVSVFFDILFIVQHYVLYPSRKAVTSDDADTDADAEAVRKKLLINSSDHPHADDV